MNIDRFNDEFPLFYAEFSDHSQGTLPENFDVTRLDFSSPEGLDQVKSELEAEVTETSYFVSLFHRATAVGNFPCSRQEYESDQLPPKVLEYASNYMALVRSLTRRKGFGIYFVKNCEQNAVLLAGQFMTDVKEKNFQILNLKPENYRLLDTLQNLSFKGSDVVIITGIEQFLSVSQENDCNVVPFLQKLNLERDLFRDQLDVTLLFLICEPAAKLFVRYAPDFFDWRSGSFDLDIAEEAKLS